MTTPLIMLGLLIAPLIVSGVGRVLVGRWWIEPRTAACLGITLVFCFTGLGHFVQTEPMAAMLPPWLPSETCSCISLAYRSSYWPRLYLFLSGVGW